MPIDIRAFRHIGFTINRSRLERDVRREIHRLDSLARKVTSGRGKIGRVMMELGQLILREAQARCPVDSGKLRDSGKVQLVSTPTGLPKVRISFETPYASIVHDFWIPPKGGYPWAIVVGKHGKNKNSKATRQFLQTAVDKNIETVVKRLRGLVRELERETDRE